MERKYSLKLLVALMVFSAALTWLILSFFLGNPFGAQSGKAGPVRDFAELLAMIDEMFIGDYDEADVAAAAMRAAVDALDDEWSFYLTPDEYAFYLESSHNVYEGLGFIVAPDEDTDMLRIVSVYRDSAAEDAGLASGDLIVAIDGVHAGGYSIDDLREALARPIGDTVDLTIIRDGGAILVITAVYSYVYIAPVTGEMLEGNIGYVVIANFNDGAAENFIDTVDGLIAQGARAFIYDVRSNPGGWVSEVTGILDYLLPEGDIFVAVDRRGYETVTRSDAGHIDIPAVVLVDRFSFSAAEYFAAMLMEYRYARTVGEQTYGKSRMQTTLELRGGGALNISFSEYLTKNRVSLHDAGGLTPDYLISLSDDEMDLFWAGDLEMDDDPQMQKALEILGYLS